MEGYQICHILPQTSYSAFMVHCMYVWQLGGASDL